MLSIRSFLLRRLRHAQWIGVCTCSTVSRVVNVPVQSYCASMQCHQVWVPDRRPRNYWQTVDGQRWCLENKSTCWVACALLLDNSRCGSILTGKEGFGILMLAKVSSYEQCPLTWMLNVRFQFLSRNFLKALFDHVLYASCSPRLQFVDTFARGIEVSMASYEMSTGRCRRRWTRNF